MSDEPYISQMWLEGLSQPEFSVLFATYGAQYCSEVWLKNGNLNVTLVNVPIFLLGALAETIQSGAVPEEIGEPTHDLGS